jgi:hypothetical protein
LEALYIKIKHNIKDVPMHFHDKMMQRRVEGKFHTFLTTTLGSRQSTPSHPGHFKTWKSSLSTHLTEDWVREGGKKKVEMVIKRKITGTAGNLNHCCLARSL